MQGFFTGAQHMKDASKMSQNSLFENEVDIFSDHANVCAVSVPGEPRHFDSVVWRFRKVRGGVKSNL